MPLAFPFALSPLLFDLFNSGLLTTVHAAGDNDETQIKDTDQTASVNTVQQISNKEKLIIDATVALQHITFPTGAFIAVAAVLFTLLPQSE